MRRPAVVSAAGRTRLGQLGDLGDGADAGVAGHRHGSRTRTLMGTFGSTECGHLTCDFGILLYPTLWSLRGRMHIMKRGRLLS